MGKRISARQVFLLIAPFPPLALFKIWAAAGRPGETLLIASTMMFVYCVAVIVIAYRWDRPSYFDWAVGIYFGLATISLFLFADSTAVFFEQYAVTGIYACLFGAAFFPPLFRKAPFTCHYARKLAPMTVWDNPIFVRINMIMTYVWAVLFGLSMLLSLYPSVLTRAVVPLALILGFGLPFNLRFPDRYLRRLGLPSLAEQRKTAQAEASFPKPLSTLPSSAWEAVSGMPAAFDKEAAGDLTAVIGFIIHGAENFEAYLNIRRGSCTLEERPSGKPDLLICAPADVWLGISRGERDGQQAFTDRAYSAEGNLGVLLRMRQIFKGGTHESPCPEF